MRILNFVFCIILDILIINNCCVSTYKRLEYFVPFHPHRHCNHLLHASHASSSLSRSALWRKQYVALKNSFPHPGPYIDIKEVSHSTSPDPWSFQVAQLFCVWRLILYFSFTSWSSMGQQCALLCRQTQHDQQNREIQFWNFYSSFNWSPTYCCWLFCYDKYFFLLLQTWNSLWCSQRFSQSFVRCHPLENVLVGWLKSAQICVYKRSTPNRKKIEN